MLASPIFQPSAMEGTAWWNDILAKARQAEELSRAREKAARLWLAGAIKALGEQTAEQNAERARALIEAALSDAEAGAAEAEKLFEEYHRRRRKRELEEERFIIRAAMEFLN
jgi:hypothetical protein